MEVKFSKSCDDCVLTLVVDEDNNFYEVHLGEKAVGKKVSVTISPQ